MSKRYNELLIRLHIKNKLLNWIKLEERLCLLNLHIKFVQVTCAKQCTTKTLKTKIKYTLSKLRKTQSQIRNLRLKQARIHKLNQFTCPIVGIILKQLSLKSLINGIFSKYIQNNILRTSGNQIVIGKSAIFISKFC
jgi:hypothetical protein